jgi:choline kinase
MIGVILAAGMAKRLRPLTATKPKCLLTVGDKTLLQRTVDAIHQTGITEFLVITGYCADQIRDFLTTHYNSRPSTVNGQQSPVTFRFIHNADYEHNNNIYSLWLAMREVRGRDVLLMDSDILCDPAAVVRVAAENGPALAVNRHELAEEEMKVVVDSDGRITEISKTCKPADAMGESVGIEHITPDYGRALADELDLMIEKEGLIDIFYERAFERLIPQGHTFKVIDTTEFFSYEIDTPEDYERAKALFLS